MEYNLNEIKDYFEYKYLNNINSNISKINVDSTIIADKIEKFNIKNKINTNICSDNNEATVTETDILTENTDYLFLKPWNKLNQVHKIIKIKEFVNNLDTNKTDKETIKDAIIDIIKNKKKITIMYDDTKGKVISISLLCFKNGKYYIENTK